MSEIPNFPVFSKVVCRQVARFRFDTMRTSVTDNLRQAL